MPAVGGPGGGAASPGVGGGGAGGVAARSATRAARSQAAAVATADAAASSAAAAATAAAASASGSGTPHSSTSVGGARGGGRSGKTILAAEAGGGASSDGAPSCSPGNDRRICQRSASASAEPSPRCAAVRASSADSSAYESWDVAPVGCSRGTHDRWSAATWRRSSKAVGGSSSESGDESAHEAPTRAPPRRSQTSAYATGWASTRADASTMALCAPMSARSRSGARMLPSVGWTRTSSDDSEGGGNESSAARRDVSSRDGPASHRHACRAAPPARTAATRGRRRSRR